MRGYGRALLLAQIPPLKRRSGVNRCGFFPPLAPEYRHVFRVRGSTATRRGYERSGFHRRDRHGADRFPDPRRSFPPDIAIPTAKSPRISTHPPADHRFKLCALDLDRPQGCGITGSKSALRAFNRLGIQLHAFRNVVPARQFSLLGIEHKAARSTSMESARDNAGTTVLKKGVRDLGKSSSIL